MGTTLDGIPHGVTVIVKSIQGPRSEALRLMEMGLLRGTRVRTERAAPLGDPVELRLRGYSLSIRRAQARMVEVELTDTVKRAPE